MLLRRLVAILCPPLLCLLTAAIFQWLERWMDAGSFFLFVLKGLAFGACIGLLLPVAGISTHSNGLARWLYGAAGVLVLILVYHYLQATRLVNWPVLQAVAPTTRESVLLCSAAVSFLLLTAIMHRKR